MNLRQSFPSLSLFSDIDWKAVEKEYEPSSKFITFPEYLALKAEEGDCPQYVYELAYFDSALTAIMESEFEFPDKPGTHLNPSACFLSLDHDILNMVKLAQDGTIQVIEKRNVLCMYVDAGGEIRFHELTVPELELLQGLEEGHPLSATAATDSLQRAGLILKIS